MTFAPKRSRSGSGGYALRFPVILSATKRRVWYTRRGGGAAHRTFSSAQRTPSASASSSAIARPSNANLAVERWAPPTAGPFAGDTPPSPRCPASGACCRSIAASPSARPTDGRDAPCRRAAYVSTRRQNASVPYSEWRGSPVGGSSASSKSTLSTVAEAARGAGFGLDSGLRPWRGDGHSLQRWTISSYLRISRSKGESERVRNSQRTPWSEAPEGVKRTCRCRPRHRNRRGIDPALVRCA